MNKNFKNLFLAIFILGSLFSFSFVLAVSGRDLVLNAIVNNLPGAGQVLSGVLDLEKKLKRSESVIEELRRGITPNQALNLLSESVGLSPEAKEFLHSIINLAPRPSQPSTSSQTPSSLTQPSTPTQQLSPGQLIQQFHQLEYQSAQQTSTQPSAIKPTTTTKIDSGSDKVRRYYCDRTTVQCLYTVVDRSSTRGSDSGYYSSLAECQANCKKAPYVCYRYEYRYSGSGCNYGWQCVPYASDNPCKNECSPSGTPLTGTAQQPQPQPQPQSQPQTQPQQTTQTPATPGSSSITQQPSSGWTSDPYTQIPGRQCIRQEGNCPQGSGNCLSCPSGYFRKSGGCSCPCDRSKPCSCYITCCSR